MQIDAIWLLTVGRNFECKVAAFSHHPCEPNYRIVS